MFDTCFPNNYSPLTPCILNLFVWIWCWKHLIHWCIGIFIVVFTSIFIRLCIRMLPRFPIVSFKAFVKECECRRTIVVWNEYSFTNAQLFLFLAISSYPKNLWYFITPLQHCHWNQLFTNGEFGSWIVNPICIYHEIINMQRIEWKLLFHKL